MLIWGNAQHFWKTVKKGTTNGAHTEIQGKVARRALRKRSAMKRNVKGRNTNNTTRKCLDYGPAA
jgi:hypothetical protein